MMGEGQFLLPHVEASTAPPPPYGADSRAKGWRFEIDYEKLEQSDTWALARTHSLRGALLLLWVTAWRQEPCGTLPADDTLICARLGMDLAEFVAQRHILMRGWYLASDGRLYHRYMTTVVLRMMQVKTAERDRKRDYRLRKSGAVPRDTTVTGDDETGSPPGRDATRTRTRTGTGINPPATTQGQEGGESGKTETSGFTPTPAGAICKALRQAGIADTNPGHPRLLAVIEAGATLEEFTGFAPAAVKGSKGFAWILGAVEGERRRAKETAEQIHQGPLQAEEPWHQTRAGVEAMGEKLGLGRWDESAAQLGRADQWPTYQARVFRAANHSTNNA
jgi:hypothetical protein